MVSGIGIALAIGAAWFLAGQTLSIRLATRRGLANDVLVVVMLVNVVVLIPLALVLDPNPTITPLSILAFGVAGLVGTMVGRAFFYAGIKRVGASRAEPIKASMPLHATIFAVILLGEQVTGPQLVGIVLMVGGIALVSWEGSSAERAAGTEIPWFGLSLPLIAAVFFGLEPIFANVGFDEGTSVLTGLAIKTIVALTTFVLYLRWRSQLPHPKGFSREELVWGAAAGLANTAFLLAYYAALEIARVGVVVPIMQTSPLIVIGVSALFLRQVETVTPRLLGAAGVIVGGGVLVTLGG